MDDSEIDDPIFNKEYIPEDVLDITQDLDHKQIVHLSRNKGGTTFSRYRMRNLNIGFHGNVQNGPVNWYFVWSEKSDVLMASGPKERKFLVSMFTPTRRILSPYQTIDEYDDQSRMCVFSNEDDAISRARNFVVIGRYISPKDFRWF